MLVSDEQDLDGDKVDFRSIGGTDNHERVIRVTTQRGKRVCFSEQYIDIDRDGLAIAVDQDGDKCTFKFQVTDRRPMTKADVTNLINLKE